MKLAIMQPYLFPYIGYFQLIKSVDYFGIGDDVKYIKQGWINRNKILINNKVSTFTFSLVKDSHSKNIMDRYLHENFIKEKDILLNKLYMGYNKAPFFLQTMGLVEEILNFESFNLSLFIENSLKVICNYLNINVIFLKSEEWCVDNDDKLSTQERVVHKILKLKEKYNINQFVNPLGGVELYSKDFFKAFNFDLYFLKPGEIYYKQFYNGFVSNLSIIDVLMLNSIKDIECMLDNYELT